MHEVTFVTRLFSVSAKPVIAAKPEEVTSVIGGSVTFKCPVITAGIPEASVEWYFNGQRVLPDGRNVFIQQTPDCKFTFPVSLLNKCDLIS